MTSPVGTLFNGMLNQLGAGSEFGTTVSTEQRRRLLRGIFAAYYADQARQGSHLRHQPHVVRPHAGPARSVPRGQGHRLRAQRGLGHGQHRAALPGQPLRDRPACSTTTSSANTVYSRVDTLAQRNRLVGYPWAALKEAFYGEHAESLLVIDYDLLARAPDKVLPLIYQFLGEEPYPHDFTHVHYDAPEFDAALGLHGLHKVRPEVKIEERATILPPDLFEQYAGLSFWTDQRASRANVITAHPSPLTRRPRHDRPLPPNPSSLSIAASRTPRPCSKAWPPIPRWCSSMPNRTALSQIAAYLAQHPGAGAVDIVAHGWEGNLWLGNSFLDAAALQAHAATLASIGQHLSTGGDIQVYSLRPWPPARMARPSSAHWPPLTGADVAASSNRTGTGGDWQLEVSTGTIEAATPFSQAALDAYNHSLATLTVTSNADSGAGTLRNAIFYGHGGGHHHLQRRDDHQR